MEHPLFFPLIGLIAFLMITLLIVSWNNREGGEMRFRSWYWKTFDLEPLIQASRAERAPRASEPAPARRNEPNPQPRRPAQTPKSATAAKPYIDLARDEYGYSVKCSIEGVEFIARVDTGASHSKINTATARALGIKNPKRELKANIVSTSATGAETQGANQPVDWTIGGKLFVPNVPTTILMIEDTGSNLLGMRVLDSLRMEMEGGKMRLIQV